MNKVILTGRIANDLELRTTQTGIQTLSFSIAVDRRFKSQDGTRTADFIRCVAWRQQAEFISKYFTKGSKINVVGSIQTRDYTDKDGKKVYVTEVVIDEAEFGDSKKDRDSSSNSGSNYGSSTYGYTNNNTSTDNGGSDFFGTETSDIPF